MQEVIIATKNRGKANEFVELFKKYGFQVKTLLDFPDIEEAEETGSTFEENAIIKAESLSKALNRIVLADDSGLVVDALNGRPGIYSARYAGEEKNDEANLLKVLDELQDVPDNERQARFYCAIAVAAPNQKTFTVSGTCEGKILQDKKGSFGFGYDPIFFVLEKNKAMAELLPEEKSLISHRGHALKKLANQLPVILSGAAK
ncbi:XTP/dITP diphosphatase [Bacillus sp. Bva_UNVM-123]|uniref:XTP/dITP diphosphatase n=1 Tax=Bacillus sp. Bva_UNVM-123 TaxID=2829798 RepID=UPI00391F1F63